MFFASSSPEIERGRQTTTPALTHSMEEDSTILSHMSLIGGSIALLMLAKARHNAHDAEAARQKALEGAGSSGEKKKGAAGHAGNFEQDGFFYKLEVKNRTWRHARARAQL